MPVRIHINNIKGNKVKNLDNHLKTNLKPICNCEECYLNNCIREVEIEKKQIENQKKTIKSNIDKFSIKNKNDINNLNLIILKDHIRKDVNSFKTYFVDIYNEVLYLIKTLLLFELMISVKKISIKFKEDGLDLMKASNNFSFYQKVSYLDKVLNCSKFMKPIIADLKYVEKIDSINAMFKFNNFNVKNVKLQDIVIPHNSIIRIDMFKQIQNSFSNYYNIKLVYNKLSNKEYLIFKVDLESKTFKKEYNEFSDKYDELTFVATYNIISSNNIKTQQNNNIYNHEIKEENMCPICLEENNLSQLSCCYQYIHSNCLNNYLSTQKTEVKSCPMCRQEPKVKQT